jgi:hypothetical protein
MKFSHLIAIAVIFIGTTIGWYILGATIKQRTYHVADQTGDRVSGRWGPALLQKHAGARYVGSNGVSTNLQPAKSDVKVKLSYQPVKMGLLWHRTYTVNFEGNYTFVNTSAVTQTYWIGFDLPGGNAMMDKIHFTLGSGKEARNSVAAPEQGVIVDTVQLAPNQSIPVTVSYECRGMDYWRYAFADASRIRDFTLTVNTDFTEVNFPVSSPTSRKFEDDGLQMIWKYEDAISAPGIAIEMPSELNAGPVAAQISFYAPLSLLLFLGVIMITVLVRGMSLHPVNYFFMAAGFFAFPLLFSYMVDVVPVHVSFFIAACVSLTLVCGYLRAVAGHFMFRVGMVAQMAYMVLFSYSFFFKGLTGLTLTLGGVATLSVLMMLTAKVNWSEKLGAMSPRLA